MKTLIGKITAEVVVGNFAEADVDCIVVPEKTFRAGDEYLNSLVKSAGMAEGLIRYNKVASTQGFSNSDVFFTDSGKDGVKLAHIAFMDNNRKEQYQSLFRAMYHVLVTANALGIKSIAVPAIGVCVDYCNMTTRLTQEETMRAVFTAVYYFGKIFLAPKVQEVQFYVEAGSSLDIEGAMRRKDYVTFDGLKGLKGFDFGEHHNAGYFSH